MKNSANITQTTSHHVSIWKTAMFRISIFSLFFVVEIYANAAIPSTPTLYSVPSAKKMYPYTYSNSPDDTNGPYTVIINYTDSDGAANLRHTYLQIKGSGTAQTIMYQEMTTPVQWAGEGDHLYNITASKVAITNGYRVTYNFQLKSSWTPSTNVDFEAWSLDIQGQASSHYVNDWNGIYDNNLYIYEAGKTNLIDNDGDGYYSSIKIEADADTSVTSRTIRLYLYRRDSSVGGSGTSIWNTGDYTTSGSSTDWKGTNVTVSSKGTYDFAWELYDPTWYISNRWYDHDADISNIKMEPASEDVANRSPDSPVFQTTPPSVLYPNTYPAPASGPYTVAVDYTDPDGRADIENCYLRLSQGDNEDSYRQTIMWWPGNTVVQFDDESKRLTNLSASSTTITNGYRITFSFKINGSWNPSNNVDYYAWAYDGAYTSSHIKYDRSGSYDNGLVIYDAWNSNGVDNDGDGYYSQIRIYEDSNTSLTGRSVGNDLYYRINGATTNPAYYGSTGSYTITGTSNSDSKYITVSNLSRGIYDFGWELYTAGQFIDSIWIDEDSNISNIKMEPASEDMIQTFPITPSPISPFDDEIVPSLTPMFGWSTFQDGGDGNTQSGYQLRVRCDDFETWQFSIPSDWHIPPSEWAEASQGGNTTYRVLSEYQGKQGCLHIKTRGGEVDRIKIKTIEDKYQSGIYEWHVYIPLINEPGAQSSIGAFLYSPQSSTNNDREIDFEIGYGTTSARNVNNIPEGKLMCYMTVQPDNSSGTEHFTVTPVPSVDPDSWYTLRLIIDKNDLHYVVSWQMKKDGVSTWQSYGPYECGYGPSDTYFQVFCSVETLNFIGDNLPLLDKDAYFDYVSINDAIVYDTGFIGDTSGYTHTYTPGAYNDTDPVTGDTRVSQSLEYNKHYHWHARYRDSGGDWSAWSADALAAHQDFYTAMPIYTLNLTKTGNGSVKVNGTTRALPWSGNFTAGTNVTLEAIPDTYWQFSNWSGDLTGGTNPTSILMNGIKNVTANFTQPIYTLNLTKTGNGSEKVNGTTRALPWSGNFTAGTNVTLEAIPDTYWQFSNWSGDLTGGTNPTSILMNGIKNVTANFTQPCYTLATSAVNGSIIKSPDKPCYGNGEVVTLTATANAGYSFGSWTGDATGTSNPVTITMNDNKTVTANFTQITVFNITASAGLNGTVNPSGSIQKNLGGDALFTASPVQGYTVDKWKVDGVVAQMGLNEFTLENIQAGHTVEVSFMPIPMVVYVDDDNTTEPWEGTQDNPYQNIQDGINVSSDGTKIIVLPGTYLENISINGKNIELTSTDPNNPNVVATTIIDGRHAGSVITITNANPTINGFTITNGLADKGGGIFCKNSTPSLSNCIISNNTAGHDGFGGGIYCHQSNPLLRKVVFRGNVVFGNEGDGGTGGGGMCNFNNSKPELIGCTFIGNTSYDDGGGIYNDSSNPVLINCVLTGNRAWSQYRGGGGIININSSPLLKNCTIIGNEIYTSGSGILNEGGSSPVLKNCIIWANLFWGEFTSDQIGGGSPLLTYCCIQDDDPNDAGIPFGGAANGNTDDNPLFADPSNGDFHLKSQYGRWSPASQSWVVDDVTSPCIDAGNPVDPNWKNELWPHGKRINMGAYGGTPEASMSSADVGLMADMNYDDVVNMEDFSKFSTDWSGKNTYQIPHGTVAVDGNLNEWSGEQWIALDTQYYQNPEDILSARFALRWNKGTNKIYAAVIVQDSNQVFQDSYGSWDASDRLEVYCQGRSVKGGTGWVGTYDIAQQYYVAPNTANGSWAAWALGQAIAPNAGFEYAVKVYHDLIVYEVGVTSFENYGGFSQNPTVVKELNEGLSVGFDIIALTRNNAAGCGMLSENAMTGKSGDAGKFAQYTLVKNKDTSTPVPNAMDLNLDNIIDLADLLLFVEEWLEKDNTPDIMWVSINDSGAGMKDGSGNPISHGGFTGYMSKYETTNAQFAQYLNQAKVSGDITVNGIFIVGTSGTNPGTDFADQYYYQLNGTGITYDNAINGGKSRILYNNGIFTVESGFENHPVTYVSWYGATAFASYYGWRLPTEWEWQAVADFDGTYIYGHGPGTITNSLANYYNSVHPDGTTAVGTYAMMHGYGLADMAGNVFELTDSIEGSYRVTRGGSWGVENYGCVVSNRYYLAPPNVMYIYYGFRVCR